MARKKKPSGGRKLSPVKAKKLINTFTKIGYEISRQTGSHVIMRHPDRSSTLPIPIHGSKNVQPEIILGLIRKARLTREQYFDLL